jgi:hypothetical protein
MTPELQLLRDAAQRGNAQMVEGMLRHRTFGSIDLGCVSYILRTQGSVKNTEHILEILQKEYQKQREKEIEYDWLRGLSR